MKRTNASKNLSDSGMQSGGSSFVATPRGETLFVGMYRVRGVRKARTGETDPITNQTIEGYHRYDLALESILSEYSGKLIVDWGRGYKAWVQRADNQEKKIVEIRRSGLTHQVHQIVSPTKLEGTKTNTVYADFGEAPDDDPNELRTFASKVRRGQPQFRDKLIRLYRSKCAITERRCGTY